MTELQLPGKIRRLGQLKWFKTPNGHTVIILPTCSVPHTHLIPENWGEINPKYQGTNRLIRLWTELKDGTKLGKNALFEKGPEHNLSPSNLHLWGFGEQETSFIPGESKKVEDQIKWEARILLELKRLKKHAEKPQAIILKRIEWPNGGVQWEKSLIIKKENMPRNWSDKRPRSPEEMIAEFKDTLLLPVDIGEHNQIRNRKGGTIIDVARWQVKTPKYRKFRTNLQNEVASKYFEEKRAKK